MIKINLLPIKHDRRREAGRNQIAIGLLAVILELVISAVLYMNLDDEIAQQRNLNSAVDAKISQIQKNIAGHDDILKEITEYEQRQDAIEELQAARTGPVQVMLEISRILSKGGRPTVADDVYREIIKKNPSRGYDENWDYRRVWMESFVEESKHVTIKGKGVSHEDVAEFLRRINLSAYFVSSELVSTSLVKPSLSILGDRIKDDDTVVSFVLVGDVRYR